MSDELNPIKVVEAPVAVEPVPEEAFDLRDYEREDTTIPPPSTPPPPPK